MHVISINLIKQNRWQENYTVNTKQHGKSKALMPLPKTILLAVCLFNIHYMNNKNIFDAPTTILQVKVINTIGYWHDWLPITIPFYNLSIYWGWSKEGTIIAKEPGR